jgi:hypothetical protein
MALKHRAVIVLLFCMPILARADFTWSRACLSAYQECLQLNAAQCKRLLAIERKEHPSNRIPVLIESQLDFLLAMALEDKAAIQRIQQNSDERIKLIRLSGKGSPYQRLCIAEIHFHSAVVAIRFERSLFSGTMELRRSFLLLEENQKLFPDFPPNLKLLGLYHAVSGTIPRNYQWAASMLGFNGTINQGIKELNILYKKSLPGSTWNYLNDECVILLGYLESKLAHLTDWDRMLKRIGNQNKILDKPLMIFSASGILNTAGKNDSLIQLLNAAPNACAKLPYLNYTLALARLQRLDRSVFPVFASYLEFYKGNAYRYAAIQKIAWSKAIEGDVKGYLKSMAQLKSIDPDDCITDEDKAAVSEAIKGVMPHPGLLRARLLFDGGYYSEAERELAGIAANELRSEQKLEYNYRRARVYDKSGRQAIAIPIYTNVYLEGKNLPYVYAANAALSLAELHEKNGKLNQSAEWYSKTLALRNHEYQNSIDQKARAGLDRIKKR